MDMKENLWIFMPNHHPVTSPPEKVNWSGYLVSTVLCLVQCTWSSWLLAYLLMLSISSCSLCPHVVHFPVLVIFSWCPVSRCWSSSHVVHFLVLVIFSWCPFSHIAHLLIPFIHPCRCLHFAFFSPSFPSVLDYMLLWYFSYQVFVLLIFCKIALRMKPVTDVAVSNP